MCNVSLSDDGTDAAAGVAARDSCGCTQCMVPADSRATDSVNGWSTRSGCWDSVVVCSYLHEYRWLVFVRHDW